MERKAFVLLSGGLDSTVALALACRDYGNDVQGISIDYGQRHVKEAEFAAWQCQLRGLTHTIIPLDNVLRGGMLTSTKEKIPDITYGEIKGVSPTYVPFRNGTMLSVITAHAQRWVNDEISHRVRSATTKPDPCEAAIYMGAHADDAHNWAYPDCTPEFLGAMANAIYIGTYHAVRLRTPLMSMTKAEIVRVGYGLNVDFAMTWSCYAGSELHCGACPTCYSRQEAFEQAGVIDPTRYAVPRKAV